MKRVGNIFGAVVERDNLRDAFLKASRGKRSRLDQRRYAENLDVELERLREGLLNVDYPVGGYSRFMIYDPKEREICVAPFGERVLHHALMNVCEPFFDRWLVFDTYACRKGKGQLRAVRRAARFAARYAWFLKCDFRKFFDSVPHEGLKRLVERKFKDPFVIAWFERIVAAYEKTPGRGPKVDYREVLNADDFATFAKLREVRKPLAEAEGVAVFAVATNEQLAQFAREKAKTLAALQAIPGFGAARAEKYGEAFLAALAEGEKGGDAKGDEAKGGGE